MYLVEDLLVQEQQAGASPDSDCRLGILKEENTGLS